MKPPGKATADHAPALPKQQPGSENIKKTADTTEAVKNQAPAEQAHHMERMPGMAEPNPKTPIPQQEVPGVAAKGKIVRYDLYVGYSTVNYTGKNRTALVIKGSLPAPTLYFTKGDIAVIYMHNTLKQETSIHWHGVILPNQYDGVPLPHQIFQFITAVLQ